MSQTLELLIKPASGLCNLRCRYCFYHDVPVSPLEIMSYETLETLVREAFAFGARSVSFAFQGGEPTLAGLDFFREFIRLEQEYRPEGVSSIYSIQTNGTLLDASWAVFFKKHNFLVGVSLDGPAEIHNQYRISASEKATFTQVRRAVDLLERSGVQYNILCVVTNSAARRAQAVYQYFKKQGFEYLQFIPCLDPVEHERGREPYSLTPARYADFLKTLFDLWYSDFMAGRYISIRLFDDYVRLSAGLPSGTCATSGRCGRYCVIESDGSVYPCDFYVSEEWRLGRLGEQSLSELMKSPLHEAFIEKGRIAPAECGTCEYGAVCRGGCMRDRFTANGGEHNYCCEVFREFFSYALPRIKQTASLLKSEGLLY